MVPSMKAVHQHLALWVDGNDAYTFVPTEAVGARSLTVHRMTGDIVLNPPSTPISPHAQRHEQVVYGILGSISLSLSEYLIIIVGREVRGRLMDHDIYRATDFEILPLNPNTSVEQPLHPVETHLLALVRSHLSSGQFLMSYDWDITRRLQAQWKNRDNERDLALWEVADDRFFWNKFQQSRFIDACDPASDHDLSPYILPVMYGTFDIRSTTISGRRIHLSLVSRRSRFRAGTRYFRRGIDHDGNVANFNETEQLLLVEHAASSPSTGDEFSTKFSFVQIRGSVPVFWAEINTLRYKPDLQIMDLQESVDAMRRHFQQQIALYGKQIVVNLVNQKGYEHPVKEAYERNISQINLPQVKYEYFDFHNECKGMRFERTSVLVDRIEEDLAETAYFRVDAEQDTPILEQHGVVRTNCMDNLDRTNVMQAALGKRAINVQLRSVGILPEGGSIDDYESFSKDFREMWTDHADLISKAYSGTGALKTDFTRTNKRSREGALQDGYKSVLRYVKNNFFDGTRQDAFDLMTGSWVPRKNPSTALFLISDSRPLLIRSMPYVVYFSLFMICAGLTLPRTSDYSLMYYFALWFTALIAAFAFIMLHGMQYVNWPRLLPPTDIIDYSGPGFRSGRKGGAGRKGIDGGKGAWRPNGRPRAGSGTEEIEMGARKRLD